MEAPGGKVLGEVPRLPAAPVRHGGQGVVEGIEGGGVVPLPAGVPQGAAAAHLVRRPVKNGGHVPVIGAGAAESALHGLVELPESTGRLPQAFPHIGGGPVPGVIPPLLGEAGGGLPQQPVRQQ